MKKNYNKTYKISINLLNADFIFYIKKQNFHEQIHQHFPFDKMQFSV